MEAWCRDIIAAERRDHQFLAQLSHPQEDARVVP